MQSTRASPTETTLLPCLLEWPIRTSNLQVFCSTTPVTNPKLWKSWSATCPQATARTASHFQHKKALEAELAWLLKHHKGTGGRTKRGELSSQEPSMGGGRKREWMRKKMAMVRRRRNRPAVLQLLYENAIFYLLWVI
jgi:hypothetical protein